MSIESMLRRERVMRLVRWWWTGGRPMRQVQSNLFYDVVSGRAVHLYKDKFGRYWMASNRWGFFRVAANKRSSS